MQSFPCLKRAIAFNVFTDKKHDYMFYVRRKTSKYIYECKKKKKKPSIEASTKEASLLAAYKGRIFKAKAFDILRPFK